MLANSSNDEWTYREVLFVCLFVWCDVLGVWDIILNYGRERGA